MMQIFREGNKGDYLFLIDEKNFGQQTQPVSAAKIFLNQEKGPV